MISKVGYILVSALLATLLGASAVSAQVDPEKANTEKVYGKYEAFDPEFALSEISSKLDEPLTLDDCIQIALANNLSLQIAREELDRTWMSLSGTYGKFYPVLSLGAEAQRNTDFDSLSIGQTVERHAVTMSINQELPTGASLALTGDVLLRDRTLLPGLTDARDPTGTYNVVLTQPLLNGFGSSIAKSNIRLAKYDFLGQDYQLENQLLTLVFEVRQAYYDVVRKHRTVVANREAVKRDSTLIDISRAKVEAKVATRRDILSAEIVLQEDLAKLIRAQTDRKAFADQLANIMGLPSEYSIDVADRDLEFSSRTFDQEGWIESAMKNNPLIKGSRVAVESNRFLTKVTSNARLPELNLVGSYSQTFDRGDTFIQRARGWTGGLVLNYPIANRAAETEHTRAQLALRQAEKNLQDTERAVVLAIKVSVSALQNSVQEIQALQKAIEAAKQKVDFATVMFNLGRASNLDITDAQESLLQSEVDLVDAIAVYYVELARIESLTGGFQETE